MTEREYMTWWGLIGVFLLHLCGLLHVIHALMNVRTSQGTIAWVLSLLTLPWIAIPLYWLLGRTRFSSYVRERREGEHQMNLFTQDIHRRLRIQEVAIEGNDTFSTAAKQLGDFPFTRGNQLSLLVNGEETFEAIFSALDHAKSYVCINFFIVKNDEIGIMLQQKLIQCAKRGVRVSFLYDEVGSHLLSRKYLQQMREAGIDCRSFGGRHKWASRLQINFRNHRKIVIVDGEVGFIGGLNVGDEYVGKSKRFGLWRDTHLKMRGPTVEALQLVFVQDWYWATGKTIDLIWERECEPDDQIAAIIPTGPADPLDSWHLLLAEAANSARKKLWIASPYFVPDEAILTALQLAAIRGVDVRIMIPEKADHLLVWLSAFTYYEQSIPHGIKIFRYLSGFLHQKVLLVDDRLAAVGSANLDNRSFRLNFEITAFSPDPKFIQEVTTMLQEDFVHCQEECVTNFTEKPFYFRLAARIARLMAPLQ